MSNMSNKNNNEIIKSKEPATSSDSFTILWLVMYIYSIYIYIYIYIILYIYIYKEPIIDDGVFLLFTIIIIE